MEKEVSLARAYRDGKGVEKDLIKAAEHMRVAHRSHSMWANELYDILYAINTPESLKEMIEVITPKAESGDSGAQGRLGRAYRDGKGVEKDLIKAAEHMRVAHRSHSMWANELYDILYAINTPESLKEMIEVITPKAESGDSGAQGRLGRAYRDGKGVEKDLIKAAEHMRVAHRSQSMWANELYDILYAINTPESLKEMIEVITPKAESGDPWAQIRLGRAYRDGKGVEKNVHISKTYFESVLNLGHKWAQEEYDEVTWMCNALNSDVTTVVYCTNDTYAPHAVASIHSLIKNSNVNKLYEIIVYHSGLSKSNRELITSEKTEKCLVRCRDVSHEVDYYFKKIYAHNYFSLEMYYRLLIPILEADKQHTIYIDCDTLVLNDVSLLKDDVPPGHIGGVRNVMHSKMKKYVSSLNIDFNTYLNSGVLIFNNKVDSDYICKINEIISKHPNLEYPDQDIINILYSDKKIFLDMRWNYLWHIERLLKSNNKLYEMADADIVEYTATSKNISILHYTGDKKPWTYNAISGAELYWEYLAETNAYPIVYNNFLESSKKLKKFKFEFVNITADEIIFSCSYYDVLDHIPSIDVEISGKIKHIVETGHFIDKQQDVIIYKTAYEINLNRYDTKCEHIIIYVDYKKVLFEYGKHFPLNGIKTSYCSCGSFLIYRKDYSLTICKYSSLDKFKKELTYSKSLFKLDFKKSISVCFCRWFYHIAKKINKSHIWLIADRPSVAGDNGEAFFKYCTTRDEITPIFIIDKSSFDYKRMCKIGKVVPSGSLKHKILYLLSEAIIVSQTDSKIYSPINDGHLKDTYYNKTRVFLQHGITKDDVSRIYSRYYQNFSLFVSAAKPEKDSIVSQKRYGLDDNRVILTGFPRHDLLLPKQSKKIIIIAPTWRKNLVEDMVNKKITPSFKSSDFFIKYHHLLTNNKLIDALKEHGYHIQFILHDLFSSAIDLFNNLDESIDILGLEDRNYSKIFSEGSLLITDYSSNSFEFAYLRKPVLYFHFDSEEFFKSHTYEKGYFDYDEDGFGKVIIKESDLVDEIIAMIKKDCIIDDMYLKRINSFFEYDDQNNSKRTFDAILEYNNNYKQ